MNTDPKSAATDPAPPARPAADSPPGLPRYRSTDLFRGGREIVIDHHERVYRLRVTAQGKLILTA